MASNNPPSGENQSDSILAALHEYDALARLSIASPELARHPFIALTRKKALDRLISLSEAIS